MTPPELDEKVELYALDRLPEGEIASLEEHLFLCASCQESFDRVEAFAVAMRQAVEIETMSSARADWFSWLRQPAIGWCGGFAALLLAIGLYSSAGRSSVAPVASLQLHAVRGEVESISPARETDITLADAPIGGALNVEVLDAKGGKVWSARLASGGVSPLKIMMRLAQDYYVVRLYDQTGTFLHEYGFQVRSPSGGELTRR